MTAAVNCGRKWIVSLGRNHCGCVDLSRFCCRMNLMLPFFLWERKSSFSVCRRNYPWVHIWSKTHFLTAKENRNYLLQNELGKWGMAFRSSFSSVSDLRGKHFVDFGVQWHKRWRPHLKYSRHLEAHIYSAACDSDVVAAVVLGHGFTV